MKLILLIDDDEFVRQSFGMVLTANGYRVIEADSGASGLELARQHIPDLILTDINMPGGNGQELLRQIRTDPDLASRQVVMMTGRPDMVSPRKGMEQGADDFLVKPVTSEALLASVAARLGRADIHWRVQDSAVLKWQGEITSHLPHEFFTPLAGILGLSELLCGGGMPNLSEEELRELHKDIHQSALRLNRSLRNYLMIAQPEPPDLQPSLPLLPEALREALWQGVERAAERHGRQEDITVQWSHLPLRITPQDFSLVVEELVDNALKFSRAGSPVSVHLTEAGELVIGDAGRGMTEEEIEQIGAFRQFERKKYEQQGLGLGLALVQRIAERAAATFSALPRSDGPGLQVRVLFPITPTAS